MGRRGLKRSMKPSYKHIPENGQHIITVDDLSKAIRSTIDSKSISEEDDVLRMAERILNFFGFSDRIIDNLLEPEERDLFYTLEDYGLMAPEREEVTLADGREWRVHYWRLRRDKILESAKMEEQKRKEHKDNGFSIYEELPEDVWTRN